MKVLKSMVRAVFFTPVRRLRKRARHARRQRDEKVLLEHAPLTVRSGPFAGMNLEGACSPLGPKVLGTYEMELWALIETITRSPVQHVVNVGAADGFYAVGFLRHLPMARATAFEMLTSHHAHIDTLARTNGVRDRLAIHGACEARRCHRHSITMSERSDHGCRGRGTRAARCRSYPWPSLRADTGRSTRFRRSAISGLIGSDSRRHTTSRLIDRGERTWRICHRCPESSNACCCGSPTKAGPRRWSGSGWSRTPRSGNDEWNNLRLWSARPLRSLRASSCC